MCLSGVTCRWKFHKKELESLNARFVWILELEKEDIAGMVVEHAARAGIVSIAIPAYWIPREGTRWSLEHKKARKDENVILYLRGGGFAVRFFSLLHPALLPIPISDGGQLFIPPNRIVRQRDAQVSVDQRLIQRQRLGDDPSNTHLPLLL